MGVTYHGAGGMFADISAVHPKSWHTVRKAGGVSMKGTRISSHLTPLSLLLATLLAFAPGVSAGNSPLVLDLTSGGFATEPLASAVAGWEFHLSAPLTIGAVGLWDEGNSPLSISHDVGLWMSDGTPILVTTVSNGSLPVASASPNGQWLFTPITPVTLLPGDYVLAAVWGDPVGGADLFRLNANAVDQYISYTGSCVATELPTSTLVFPGCGPATLSNASFFGPNLAVVPEPGSIAIFAIGLLAVSDHLRRRFRL